MGKLERLHRTMKADLLQGRRFLGFEAAQAGLDTWRRHDNHDRPHEALDGAVPASRYRMSRRAMPATLPEPGWDLPRLVQPLPHCRGQFPDQCERPSVTHLFARLYPLCPVCTAFPPAPSVPQEWGVVASSGGAVYERGGSWPNLP